MIPLRSLALFMLASAYLFNAALAWSSPANSQKNALPLFLLGSQYFWGDTVPQDKKKAFHCYQIAAQQGLAAAQCSVGKMYREGHGPQKDDTKAFAWFQKAANQGHIEAQYFLGEMYLEGRGVRKNTTKAFEWLLIAANEGHGEAAFRISQLYAEGRGTKRDEEKASEWLIEARDQRYPIGKALTSAHALTWTPSFKRLVSSCLPNATAPANPHIVSIASFKEAFPVLESLPPDALVIFDLDDTLIVSRDVTLPSALTESSLLPLVQLLNRKGIASFVLTKTMSEEEGRHQELLPLGLNFGKNFPEHFIFTHFVPDGGKYPLFSNGTLYTNGLPKGKVLAAFLDKMKTRLSPSLIVFFDDRLDNLLDVQDMAQSRRIAYQGFLYTQIVRDLERGLSYQDIHEKLLRTLPRPTGTCQGATLPIKGKNLPFQDATLLQKDDDVI